MSIAYDIQDIWFREGVRCAVMDEPVRSMMQLIRACCVRSLECEDGHDGYVKFFIFCDLSLLMVEQDVGNVVTRMLGYDCVTVENDDDEED